MPADEFREELVNCCRKLRLSSALAERAETIDGDTHIEFLYNLFRAEIRSREITHIGNLVTGAHFPVKYRFEQFRSEQVEFPEDCALENIKSLQFYRESKNLILYGGTGTGKTMLSICAGMSACEKGIPVAFYRTAKLVNKLSIAQRDGKLDKTLEKLNKASIFILDEFGYVPYDRTGINLLFDFLSEISDDPTKVIILSTNLEFSRWVNVLYDQQMTAALIGRLTHHCHLILFPGENNRLKESSINSLYRSIAERQEREDLKHV